MEANICWRLVELLKHRSWRVTKPALRTIGNIVCAEDEVGGRVRRVCLELGCGPVWGPVSWVCGSGSRVLCLGLGSEHKCATHWFLAARPTLWAVCLCGLCAWKAQAADDRCISNHCCCLVMLDSVAG